MGIWVVVGLVLILAFLAPNLLRDKLRSVFQKTQ
jgi:hypothetical protein